MLELLSHGFMQRAVLASLLGGTACGIVGAWVVLLRIPFVGVAMSHAAFAGSIVGLLVGINPLVGALLLCTLSALLIGPIADRGELSPNVSIGILFTLVLGIAFLALGMLEGPRTRALQLLWGSILTTTPTDVLVLAATTLLVLAFVILFHKELTVLIYNREVARALGIAERPLFYALLVLTGLAVTANLQTIGGLLIFSLIVSPASAAYQLTYRISHLYLLSVLFAIASCLAGLAASWWFNTPSGASIIMMSSILFGLCLWLSPKRTRTPR